MSENRWIGHHSQEPSLFDKRTGLSQKNNAGQISGFLNPVAMNGCLGDPDAVLQKAPYSISLMLTCLVLISLVSPAHSFISYLSFEIPSKILNTPSSDTTEGEQEKSISIVSWIVIMA